MIVKHKITLPTINAADKVVKVLGECGIPVTVEEKNAVQKILHIEMPDDATFDDALALGVLIGSVETAALAKVDIGSLNIN